MTQANVLDVYDPTMTPLEEEVALLSEYAPDALDIEDEESEDFEEVSDDLDDKSAKRSCQPTTHTG